MNLLLIALLLSTLNSSISFFLLQSDLSFFPAISYSDHILAIFPSFMPLAHFIRKFLVFIPMKCISMCMSHYLHSSALKSHSISSQEGCSVSLSVFECHVYACSISGLKVWGSLMGTFIVLECVQIDLAQLHTHLQHHQLIIYLHIEHHCTFCKLR